MMYELLRFQRDIKVKTKIKVNFLPLYKQKQENQFLQQMASNLWNTQSPTKRIDLYFKIDDYKKHILLLKNVKSTFHKTTNLSFSRSQQIDNNFLSKSNLKKNLLKQRIFHANKQSQSARALTQVTQSQRNQLPITYVKESINLSRVNQSLLSHTASPNKFQKFRTKKINEENKMILKKLQNVKASPQLSKKNLIYNYSHSDMRYKLNLQKSKYKHVDFTKQAEKLLKGEKIKFSRIMIENLGKVSTDRKNWKSHQANLEWKLSQKNLASNNISRIISKPLR